MNRRNKYLTVVFVSLCPFILGLLIMLTDLYVISGIAGVTPGNSEMIRRIAMWFIMFGFIMSMISLAFIGIWEALHLETNNNEKFSEREIRYLINLREKIFLNVLNNKIDDGK